MNSECFIWFYSYTCEQIQEKVLENRLMNPFTVINQTQNTCGIISQDWLPFRIFHHFKILLRKAKHSVKCLCSFVFFTIIKWHVYFFKNSVESGTRCTGDVLLHTSTLSMNWLACHKDFIAMFQWKQKCQKRFSKRCGE